MAVEAMQQEQAIQHHLQYNPCPPVHSSFVPIAQKAIELVNKGEYSTNIEMPNGKVLTAAEIVEGLHLDGFLEDEEGEEK